MNSSSLKLLATCIVVALITTGHVARASPHGGIRHLLNSLAPSDWFEASGPDANCDDEVPDENGDRDDRNNGGENDDDEDDDEEDNDEDVEEFDALREETDELRGLFNDDICANAEVGESKCLCIRRGGFASLFRGRGHDLICGRCSLRFVRERRRNDNFGGNRDRNNGDIKRNRNDDEAEDFFSK